VCFAGDEKVGKTALLNRIVGEPFPNEYLSTLGVEVVSVSKCQSALLKFFSETQEFDSERTEVQVSNGKFGVFCRACSYVLCLSGKWDDKWVQNCASSWTL
jgi:hypothetical protein